MTGDDTTDGDNDDESIIKHYLRQTHHQCQLLLLP